MQERSVHGSGSDDLRMLEPLYPERHYDLVVRPTAGAGDDPACDCAGPPPPQFLLPPPPVDPAWAAADADVCDIVAPYQICSGLTGVPPGADLQGSPSMSMLAALITTSLFLFIVLVSGTIFFCKHRRRLSGIMSAKGAGKRGDNSRMLYDDLSLRPHVMPNNLRPSGPHIESRQLEHNAAAGIIVSNFSLALQDVQRSDSGVYMCVGFNVEGDGESNPIFLDVKCDQNNMNKNKRTGALSLSARSNGN
ncbi:uncharacterized protein LOC119100506 [Pollicipes pollicipes]|uniref:uncharacterized protein LOC119100506 n=1 Tax=Pollicipes pollicipes TaxID=41117 RepID=UPI0018853371|nr:uncharacterized protein LOC119100506 [Pollicipes pollicipes]